MQRNGREATIRRKVRALIWIIIIIIIIIIILVFRATLTAYGDFQAKGLIRAVAEGLCQGHGNAGSEPHLRPTPQLKAMLDP